MGRCVRVYSPYRFRDALVAFTTNHEPAGFRQFVAAASMKVGFMDAKGITVDELIETLSEIGRGWGLSVELVPARLRDGVIELEVWRR